MKECHQEQIHLCGKIQSHGYLLVFDNESCIGVSENALHLLKHPLNEILGKGLPKILQLLAPNSELDLNKIKRNICAQLSRHSEKIYLIDSEYDLTFFSECGRIFLEIEPCDGHINNIGRIYDYARLLQANRTAIWDSLCDLVRDIINFDRVAVYRFNKDKSGQVIAESKVANIDSILGFHYPEFDIPEQARALYLRFRARHVADIDAPTIDILGIDPEQLDLGQCSLRALSPIHLKYLRNAGVSASASFSIIINDQLWGLVVCQNKLGKNLDLTQRHVCALLVEYAINYYFADYQRRKIQRRTLVTDVEKQMLASLMENLDIDATIEEFADKIMKTVKAHGILIRKNDGIISFGEVPDYQEQLLLEKYIDANQSIEMFCTDKFEPLENNETAIEFPGIIRINILPAKGWFICMYRKEQVKEIVWAGKPEKIFSESGEKLNFPSPRSSFQAWRQIKKGTAKRWQNLQLSFAQRLSNMIHRALTLQGGDLEELNRKLVISNTTINTFANKFKHDLKNPLSSIKLAGQMIGIRDNLSQEFIKKLGVNVLNASVLIEKMIGRVDDLSKLNTVELNKKLIDPRSKILIILEQLKNTYLSADLQFILGDTLPVRAENNLLFQLFSNLLENAVKFRSKQEIPSISITSFKEGKLINYYIQDNGIGMDFNTEITLSEAISQNEKRIGINNQGLGLSIVNGIAEKLHINIFVQSVIDRGTIFRLEFGEV